MELVVIVSTFERPGHGRFPAPLPAGERIRLGLEDRDVKPAAPSLTLPLDPAAARPVRRAA